MTYCAPTPGQNLVLLLTVYSSNLFLPQACTKSTLLAQLGFHGSHYQHFKKVHVFLKFHWESNGPEIKNSVPFDI